MGLVNGKMGCGVWDIGIYFVGGKNFIYLLNTPNGTNTPLSHRWISTRHGDKQLTHNTITVRTYTRLF